MIEYPSRGFKMAITLELFNDIISKTLGIDNITIVSAETNGWHRAVEICAITDDERFPILEEGKMFPFITPWIEQTKIELEDGTFQKKYEFKYYNEVKE